ncbi:stress responsive A/B barrel domain-containing protein [Zopfia rhizophila CBS 207.26]|uniref:Stress responsive A/B barrel domain-containing protein n=1 Tax=Zopfia rhizophila CBS 207.26 TaxID=1314779 RepID=A0A6A6DXJ4_9PEZI|nr:stress responsive A/B barrel domain-containing protein [Zopfia rhizophila CBS 207.26]
MIFPKRFIGWIVVILFAIFITSIAYSKLNPSTWLVLTLVPTPEAAPLITHIVLFQFKQGASATAIKEINAQMLRLKKTCIHPTTQKPYIKSITGGVDNSIENLQNGITHAFIVQFSNPEDRNYYIEKDPAYETFKKAAGAILDKAQVVDFKEGAFV